MEMRGMCIVEVGGGEKLGKYGIVEGGCMFYNKWKWRGNIWRVEF
jgi:hypothetical protein